MFQKTKTENCFPADMCYKSIIGSCSGKGSIIPGRNLDLHKE